MENNERETSPLVKSDQSTEQSRGCCSCTSKVRCYLYASHILSTWGDRMWSFAVGMFMIAISPNSLRLTAIYGLTGGMAILLTGAILGDWVDRYPRMKVAGTSLVVQNICVSLSALAVFFTIYYEDDVKVMWGGWMQTVCHVAIILFANIADVAGSARTLAIERDWIVVICKDRNTLTEMSAFLRRIDLSTELLAPIVAGQVITYGSLLIGALFVAGWNIISLFFEFYMMYKVYRSVPELASKNEISNRREDTGCCSKLFQSFLVIPRGWKTYASETCVFAGIGLAFLYLTVIGLDNVTTGFAKEQGLSESVIGIVMGASGVTGIVGTFFFPVLRRKFGLIRTGLFAFTLIVVTLIPCVVSIFAPGSPFDPTFEFLKEQSTANSTILIDPTSEPVSNSLLSVLLLICGIVISRVGLWSADLTVTQLLLETPKDEERGVVNGVQTSLNRLLDMLKFILVIGVPWPEAFGYLILISYFSCFMGGVFYAIFSYKQRGHILPFHKYRQDINPESLLASGEKKTYGTARV